MNGFTTIPQDAEFHQYFFLQRRKPKSPFGYGLGEKVATATTNLMPHPSSTLALFAVATGFLGKRHPFPPHLLLPSKTLRSSPSFPTLRTFFEK